MAVDIKGQSALELEHGVRQSRIPARLDYIQSITGLILAVFMWGHLLLVSSILLGKDAMYTVTKFLEGEMIFGESYPILVSMVAIVIFVIFFIHAMIAMRKFPHSYKQYTTYKSHMKSMKHPDTNLWSQQVFTGFIMFFLGSAHVIIIMMHPADIGPYASADRVVSEYMGFLYFFLLLAVEFHGTIGIYKLVIKWGWFEGKDAKATRKRYKKIKWGVTIVFVTLGMLTLFKYVEIGLEQKENNNVGHRYVPTHMTTSNGAH
jgi:fumarate reductase subunit C